MTDTTPDPGLLHSYDDLGLTPGLLAKTSLAAQPRNSLQALTSETIPSGEMPGWAVRSIRADKISSGTLIMGGENNVSGIIQVLDNAGGLAAQQDKDGIQIFGGNITIKNNAGSIVFDATGLVGAQAFQYNTSYSSSGTHTHGLTIVDVPNSSLTFSLTRTVNVLLLATAAAYSTPNANGVRVFVNVDGSDQSMGIWCNFSTGANTGATTHIISALDAGTHTIKLRYAANSSGDDAYLNERRLTYLVLGT